MVSIGFLIAIAAAYWVYRDAKSFGHTMSSALLWAIGTLAMMIVFLPLYLIFGRKQQINSKRTNPEIIDVEASVVEESYSHCTMCGAKVKEDFNVCPYCGFTLQPKCKKCGQQLRRDQKACPSCGTPAEPK